MTRNDYFTLASAIKAAFPTDGVEGTSYTTPKSNIIAKKKLLKHLLPALKADNPSFQSFRFILSCDASDLYEHSQVGRDA